jgi:phytoene dehydrogenase-like protein
MISDPRLRAVLATQRGDYGPDPRESSFGLHAVVMHHYIQGAYFPVGGADAFPAALVPVIEQGGGEVRTRSPVVDILVDNNTVRLTAQFARHFPALAPLVVRSELSTPLSSVAFTGAEHGGVYGLEASPRRFLSNALRAQTPVAGLYLTGQDVGSAGIAGAMMGGMLAAVAFDPRLLPRIG